MQISGDPFLRLSPRRLRSVKACLSLLAVVFAGSVARGEVPSQLKGHRFLTLNTVVRVQQIEVTRDISHGEDESSAHSPAEARVFREAIEKAWPGARITWAFSWLALHDGRENYRGLRELVAGYHKQFGDEITFIPGAHHLARPGRPGADPQALPGAFPTGRGREMNPGVKDRALFKPPGS